GRQAVDAAVVPAVAGDLVPGSMQVADQVGVGLGNFADDEERRASVEAGPLGEQPARAGLHAPAVLVAPLGRAGEVGRRLDAVVLLHVEAEDDARFGSNRNRTHWPVRRRSYHGRWSPVPTAR